MLAAVIMTSQSLVDCSTFKSWSQEISRPNIFRGSGVMLPRRIFENICANLCNTVHFGVKNMHFKQLGV